MTFVSAGHIILTPTELVGSGRPQESRALPTELPQAPAECKIKQVVRGLVGLLVS